MSSSELNGQATFFKNELNDDIYYPLLKLIVTSNQQKFTVEDFEKAIENTKSEKAIKSGRIDLETMLQKLYHGGFLKEKPTYIHNPNSSKVYTKQSITLNTAKQLKYVSKGTHGVHSLMINLCSQFN